MNEIVGTRAMVRLALRRDRFVLPAWVVVMALIMITYGSSIKQLYPTAAAREEFLVGLQAAPAEIALVGPVFGSSLGALTAWRAGFLLVIIALAAALTVVRHTRAEEESGRRELVGAGVVGRQAGLVAALVVTAAGCLASGLLMTLGLVGLGYDAGGSLGASLAMTMSGWLFAAVAAVTAQLTESARAARGLALGVLGIAFLLRAAGDAASPGTAMSRLSWLSPIGWLQQLRPFSGERWWVFGLAAIAVVLLVAASFRLSARRDLGGGQLPTRPGPAGATPSLRSPLALAWRLQRTTFAAWLVGFVVYGGVVGGVAKGIAAQLGTSKALHDVLARLGGPGALTDAYFATVLGLLGTLAAGYAVASVLRLRSEEVAGTAEPVLATATSRLRWVASHAVLAFLGSALLLVVGGLATGLAYGAAVGDVARESGRLVVAALVQLPAVWLLAGLALALVGVLPQVCVAASWVVLSGCVLITEIGVSLQLSQWTLDLSPFTHIPKLPGAQAAATPLLWLTALAAVLLAVGLRGMRTRDIG